MFRGYDPAVVGAHIEMFTSKQQFLLDDVESLRARLKESGDEAAALDREVAVLTDTSPSSHAMQEARRAVDEASQQRIKILVQLMGVYRGLEGVRASLESAIPRTKESAGGELGGGLGGAVGRESRHGVGVAAWGSRKDRYSRRRVHPDP
jgi:hypothetical protein